jgi:hypothetical protein
MNSASMLEDTTYKVSQEHMSSPIHQAFFMLDAAWLSVVYDQELLKVCRSFLPPKASQRSGVSVYLNLGVRKTLRLA